MAYEISFWLIIYYMSIPLNAWKTLLSCLAFLFFIGLSYLPMMMEIGPFRSGALGALLGYALVISVALIASYTRTRGKKIRFLKTFGPPDIRMQLDVGQRTPYTASTASLLSKPTVSSRMKPSIKLLLSTEISFGEFASIIGRSLHQQLREEFFRDVLGKPSTFDEDHQEGMSKSQGRVSTIAVAPGVGITALASCDSAMVLLSHDATISSTVELQDCQTESIRGSFLPLPLPSRLDGILKGSRDSLSGGSNQKLGERMPLPKSSRAAEVRPPGARLDRPADSTRLEPTERTAFQKESATAVVLHSSILTTATESAEERHTTATAEVVERFHELPEDDLVLTNVSVDSRGRRFFQRLRSTIYFKLICMYDNRNLERDFKTESLPGLVDTNKSGFINISLCVHGVNAKK
jgi:hypothetical protein